jgi:hypothetical protein
LSCYSDFYLFLFLFFNKSFVGVDSWSTQLDTFLVKLFRENW